MEAPRPALSVGALRDEIAQGLRFLWRQRRLWAIALLSMGVNLLDGPLLLAVIVLARDELHADARTIGLIFSIAGAGELLGSFVAPWVRRAYAWVGHSSEPSRSGRWRCRWRPRPSRRSC